MQELFQRSTDTSLNLPTSVQKNVTQRAEFKGLPPQCPLELAACEEDITSYLPVSSSDMGTSCG